jgi:hypothetical protein
MNATKTEVKQPTKLDRAEFAGWCVGVSGYQGTARQGYDVAEKAAWERGYAEGRDEFEHESQVAFDAWVADMEAAFGDRDCPPDWHEQEVAIAQGW